MLRERTRDAALFRLVFAENVEYGFRRNSLGLRPIALGIAGAAAALSFSLLIWWHGDQAARLARWGVAGAISAAFLVYWWRIVTPEWVRRPAEVYADRLFEAIDSLAAGRSASTS